MSKKEGKTNYTIGIEDNQQKKERKGKKFIHSLLAQRHDQQKKEKETHPFNIVSQDQTREKKEIE